MYIFLDEFNKINYLFLKLVVLYIIVFDKNVFNIK